MCCYSAIGFSFSTNDNQPQLQSRIPIEANGWLGADGAISFPLPRHGKFLWLFGDSLIGRSFTLPNGTIYRTVDVHKHMPRNSVGVFDVDGNNVMKHYWHTEGESEHGGFWNATNSSHWL
jgi:acyl-CoA synthetase (AMP-forming)/AMP-acid ligase II